MAQELLWGTWFEPFAVPYSETLKALTEKTISNLDAKRMVTHRRKRKPQDQTSFLAAVDAILANLVLSYCDTSGAGRIAINLSHREVSSRKRYLNPCLPIRTLSITLNALEELGVLEVSLGGRGQCTTFKPTPMFITGLEARDIGLEDITHDREHDEVIILTQRQRDDLAEWPRGEQRAVLVDYHDDDDTHAMRGKVRALQAYVALLDLVFDDDGQSPRVDVSKRNLKRRFSLLPGASLSPPKGQPQDPHSSSQSNPQPSNWNHGGRLFGDAFWLGLRRDRRELPEDQR